MAFDDVPVASIDDLHAQLSDTRVGVSATITIVRDGRREQFTIVPVELA